MPKKPHAMLWRCQDTEEGQMDRNSGRKRNVPRKPAFDNRWWIVFGATLSMLVAQGPVLLYTLGLFIKPLGEEFGWDRASISAAGGIAAISSAIAIPFVGLLIDRRGVRVVLLPIIVLCATSVAFIALAPKSIVVFLLLFAITGVLGSGQGPLGYAKVVSAWFDDRRGLALGITMSGIGLGAALIPQYAQFLIGNLGWRAAYAGLGMLTLMVAFPAVLLFVREPPANERNVTAQTPYLEGRLPDLEVREALGGRRFWLIACALLMVSTVTQGLVVHTVPLLTDKGYSPEAAAALMIGVGLSTMAGRLLSGYLVDRIFAPFVATFFFLLPCLGIYLLESTISPVAGIISLGLASGTEIDMIGFLTSRYFGMKRFGQLYGYLFASFVVGSAVGPFTMGLAFERLHSYEPALWVFGLLMLFASGAILSLGPYRYPVEEQRPVGAERTVDIPAVKHT
ncbi:MFS transporter [Bradyrhizobium sp. CB1650]|uniref:MFS transporter n=1 Tax=Bradyrhizobium sp. CB1650 TaxID=3039153 RepID=UPI00243554F7|nr:MFS transporter [Bradyrhizobium sp. CB1650]WGD50175.1 MFS transporter [Bradyrhizobium sp. CB1650]